MRNWAVVELFADVEQFALVLLLAGLPGASWGGTFWALLAFRGI